MGRIDAEGYLWYSGRSPAKELIKPGARTFIRLKSSGPFWNTRRWRRRW
jgi:hypothetical protein